MMNNSFKTLKILTLIAVCLGSIPAAKADNMVTRWYNSLPSVSEFTGRAMSKKRDLEVNPYLEDARHLQIPQWEHKDWYAEDWLSQHDGMTLIKGFYEADILEDQYLGYNEVPILVVGPNFYRLSGLDKRRVVHIVDLTYGITESKDNGAFMLKDWHTKSYIGAFDHNGLRLH